VTINDGLHWHGLALVNPLALKLQARLDEHIKANLGKYLVGSTREIDVKPITHEPEYVTGYGLKSLKTRFSTDEIVIFPRSVSELPSSGPDPRKGPVRAAGEKPMYDFQRRYGRSPANFLLWYPSLWCMGNTPPDAFVD
jgi:hypothetical protein